ncbi:hypothetical protein QQS21_006160 [Conoideocrella luteorostrata]|uniref:Protein kinase domain-containing protein n=1 Tax=Conoideocrella luteorostrata TaxID=1105319 RepID=A0AAJ0CQV7_9HYPO|nr:hypothetical protein QQS21_006160 [Conoideocrella luteorostrata]
MADPCGSVAEPQPPTGKWDFFSKLVSRPAGEEMALIPDPDQTINEKVGDDETPRTVDSPMEPCSRKVITGLPRSQTFKRRLSEQRSHLELVPSTADERRAASADRRGTEMDKDASTTPADTRPSATTLHSPSVDGYGAESVHYFPGDQEHYHLSNQAVEHALFDPTSRHDDGPQTDSYSILDAVSVTASQHEAMIADELERRWILNLSMHFRDRSNREKFFVTYRQKDHLWRRVTISLDYRNAPPNSLEMDLTHTNFQREKNAKIYEAIRESLADIEFYDTVTNLKLQTAEGRLHVHVVEDGNEIIQYPSVSQIRHLGCRRVRESEIKFDSHMSGFVYKVNVKGQTLIKKEIPSPDTIDEFLYEVNALSSLCYSRNVVELYGVVVDVWDKHVKGLLISYAEQGALIDIIYDNCKEQNVGIPWAKRQRWARQIVQGLADVHESGFVQGDFTMSNIVVDSAGDAKIIDINRRGCPVGWEPPEATALIEAHHRITMYIGVKSDLYQLGMVLWGLAMLEDEPETHGRPLMLGPEINVPDWYRQMTEICLNADPRMRLQASVLLHMFPHDTDGHTRPIMSVDETRSLDDFSIHDAATGQSYVIRTVEPSSGWPSSSKTYVEPSSDMFEPSFPMRGRSPPSPLPSHLDGSESPYKLYSSTSWAANKSVRPSYSDVADDDVARDDNVVGLALRPETPLSLGKDDVDSAAYIPTDVNLEDISPKRAAAASMERKISLGDGLQILSTPKISRQDTVIRCPLSDVQPETKSNGHKADNQITSMVEGNTTILNNDRDTQDIKANDSELDGGVPLQSDADLDALGMSQSNDVHKTSSQDEKPDNGNEFNHTDNFYEGVMPGDSAENMKATSATTPNFSSRLYENENGTAKAEATYLRDSISMLSLEAHPKEMENLN